MAEIGRVGASRREVGGVNPSIDRRAFGQGVSSALSSMGEQVAGLARTQQTSNEATTTLNEAYKARQDKLESARLRADLIRLNNEMGRELQERYDGAAPGAPGFTDETQAWANERLQGFMRNVPERLRSDFAPQVESILQSHTNSAFQLQVGAENAEFTKVVGDLQRQATEQMLTAVITDLSDLDALEEQWVNDLTEIMRDSPMDAQETRALAEQISVAISSAKMVREVQEEALDNVSTGGTVPGQLQQDGQRVYSSRPVAAGLGRAAVGLLNAIAGPESGGDYNVMYSPEGRRYFSDFSNHPNNPARIATGPHAGNVSTAAGKYQFIKGTWDQVAAELGLTDFSPESQDLGAWHLARSVYYDATGRDLQAVLESGNQPAIIAAKRLLEGTWEGLKNLSDADFIDSIATATGNPSSALYAEEYSHIPLDQRMAIMNDGIAKAEEIRGRMAAEAEAQRAQMQEQLRRSIVEGQAGMADILAISKQARFSVAEQEEMVGLYAEHQTQQYNAERMVTNFEDPYFAFDPGNEDHKKQAEAFFAERRLADRLAEGDETALGEFRYAVEQNNGFVPTNMSSALLRQAQSQNPQVAIRAFEAMAEVAAEYGPRFEKDFGADMAMTVSTFNYGRGALNDEQLLTYLRNANDPMLAQARKQSTDIMNEARKDRPEDFSIQGIASQLDAEGVSPREGGALFAEYMAVYEYHLPRLQDHRKARNAAIETMKRRWGVTNVGGMELLTRYPVEQEYGPFNGSFDYIREQAIEAFPILRDKQWTFNSDSVTDYQRNNRQPPTYTVTWFDEAGMPNTLTAADTVGGRGADRSRVARFYPQVTDEMRVQLYEEQMRQEELRLRAERLREYEPGTIEGARMIEEAQRDLRDERAGMEIPRQSPTGSPLVDIPPEYGSTRGTPLSRVELPPTSAPATSPQPAPRPSASPELDTVLESAPKLLGSTGQDIAAQLQGQTGVQLRNTLQRLKRELDSLPGSAQKAELLRAINKLQREAM